MLGKEKERQMYDFKTGIKSDPDQFQTSRTGQGGDNKQRQGWRPMSFEERVKAYGFPEQVIIVILVFMTPQETFLLRTLTSTKREEITTKKLSLPV